MKSSYRINLILSITFLLALLFVILTGTNQALFMNINSLSKYTGSFIWSNLTFLGDALPAVVVMLLLIRKMPEAVWSGIVATTIATIIVNVIKSCFNLPRPPAVIASDMINIIGPAISSHSFPSGHTVTIFTLAGIIILYFRSLSLRIVIVILAILVGVSRMVVGVHWPSDVFTGAVIGILCATAGVYIVTRLGWKRNKNAQLILGGLLILTTMYLLLIYNCGYAQAVYFQRFFALIVLLAGIREYYMLLKSHN
jgi:membrane-associated phospholipid phosphatase